MKTRITSTHLIAMLALVVALAGTGMAGYAAGKANGDSLIKKGSLSGNRLKADSVTGKQVQESSLGTVPLAQQAQNATSADRAKSADTVPAPAFHPLTTVSGYVPDTTSTSRPLGYRVDASGFVHLQGAVKSNGAIDSLFMELPAGVRPADAVFAVATNGGPGKIAISTIGEVTIVNGGTSPVSLEGVTFYPDH